MNKELFSGIGRVSVAWLGAVLLSAALFATSERVTQLKWGAATWFVCSLGFYGTASVGRVLIQLRIVEDTAQRTALSREAFFALSLKLTCFSLLGMVVWAGREKAMTGILAGISTLVVVPLSWALVTFRQKKT